VSYFFYVLSKSHHLQANNALNTSTHTHTNRLFYLNFKELFTSLSCSLGREEVRII